LRWQSRADRCFAAFGAWCVGNFCNSRIEMRWPRSTPPSRPKPSRRRHGAFDLCRDRPDQQEKLTGTTVEIACDFLILQMPRFLASGLLIAVLLAIPRRGFTFPARMSKHVGSGRQPIREPFTQKVPVARGWTCSLDLYGSISARPTTPGGSRKCDVFVAKIQQL
jgi:hypothetical protein